MCVTSLSFNHEIVHTNSHSLLLKGVKVLSSSLFFPFVLSLSTGSYQVLVPTLPCNDSINTNDSSY